MLRRRFPRCRQIRALELGADKLSELLEWQLRNNPRTLKMLRRLHMVHCPALLEALEREREPK
jgi:hypothetical protein